MLRQTLQNSVQNTSDLEVGNSIYILLIPIIHIISTVCGDVSVKIRKYHSSLPASATPMFGAESSGENFTKTCDLKGFEIRGEQVRHFGICAHSPSHSSLPKKKKKKKTRIRRWRRRRRRRLQWCEIHT